jgi:peptidoglycan/xylan/chitin deacetylase (PgdA/CDA1 family)
MPTAPAVLRLRAAVAAALVGLAVLTLVPPPADAGTSYLVFHGTRARPVIALTFDDAWSFSNTQRIFEILQRRKVKATFFPYARAVLGAQPLWRRIAAAGYPIGNHTYNHARLTSLSPAGIRNELITARETIERVTGKPMLRVYRPPGRAYNATVQREAAAAGFPTAVMWDISSADTAQHSSWSSIQRRALTGSNGSIILMHCGPAVTPAILDAVITGYQKRGFRFVTVPELLGSKMAPWQTSSPRPTPTPTPAPTPTPSASPSEEPTPTPLPSESPTPAPAATATATPVPFETPPWPGSAPAAGGTALPGLDPWRSWDEGPPLAFGASLASCPRSPPAAS